MHKFTVIHCICILSSLCVCVCVCERKSLRDRKRWSVQAQEKKKERHAELMKARWFFQALLFFSYPSSPSFCCSILFGAKQSRCGVSFPAERWHPLREEEKWTTVKENSGEKKTATKGRLSGVKPRIQEFSDLRGESEYVRKKDQNDREGCVHVWGRDLAADVAKRD